MNFGVHMHSLDQAEASGSREKPGDICSRFQINAHTKSLLCFRAPRELVAGMVGLWWSLVAGSSLSEAHGLETPQGPATVGRGAPTYPQTLGENSQCSACSFEHIENGF